MENIIIETNKRNCKRYKFGVDAVKKYASNTIETVGNTGNLYIFMERAMVAYGEGLFNF